jgi:hypothetical protein
VLGDARQPPNNALKLTKRGTLSVGALRAPSSFNRASQLSAVFYGRSSNGHEVEQAVRDETRGIEEDAPLGS